MYKNRTRLDIITCPYLQDNCTKVIAQRILQIQPTMSRHVRACNKADTRFKHKAFPLVLNLVVAQHSTVGAESNVPTKIK